MKNLKNDKDTQSVTVTEPMVSRIAQNNHASYRPDLLRSLENRSKKQLIKDFTVEMDAKNKAYYFILENELLKAFGLFCENFKKEKTLQNQINCLIKQVG